LLINNCNIKTLNIQKEQENKITLSENNEMNKKETKVLTKKRDKVEWPYLTGISVEARAKT
jgi:hypothetical protein